MSLSCGPDLTGPRAGRLSNGIGFITEFPSQVAGGTDLVPFNRVHIVLSRGDESTALDTIVNYPATGDLSLTLRVRLSPDTPSEGETLWMYLEYLNANGDVVFVGGPTSVLAVPAGNTQTEPVSIPVEYVGPGSNATQVVIAEQPVSALNGDAFTFTAVALDGQGQPIAGTPIGWTSLDPTIATINAIGAGAGVAQNVRGTARIVAKLLTGPADTITVDVSLRASLLTVVSGAGQSGGIGLALTNPLVARVTASDGVGVPGVNVTFAVTAGGGSLGTPSLPSDPNGYVQTTWQLGALVGAQTVTATATGIAGSVSFNATGTSVGPTQLAFVQQPSNVTAGIPIGPSITVVAKDAQGATVPSFVGTVTIAIGTNPGSATLTGTLSTTAVAGVATFNNVRLNRAASGYTLAASSSGLTGVNSTPFNVVPAPAIAAVIDSGNAQSAAPSTLLPQKLVVKVVDSLLNGIAGSPITWQVTAGTGILTNATNTTDANGRARVTWTLGAELGQQSVQAYAEALDDVVDFTATATPPGVTKVWTGATNQAWTTATNWSPAGVPIATDVVQIPATLNQPVMSGAVTLAGLFLLPGAGLDLGTTTLTVNGTLDASGFIFGSGSVILNGTGTLQGLITGNTQTFVQGNYTLSGGTGTARIEVSGSLTFGGQVLSVTGNFLTGGTGTITMNNESDGLFVSGNAFFGGGNQTGLLTLGAMIVQGNFSQTAGTSPMSFVASPNFTVELAGTGLQSISFATPDTVTLNPVCNGSCFGGLVIANNGSDVIFSSAASVRGDFSVVNGASVNAIGTPVNPRVITVGGATTTVPGVAVHINRFRTTGDIFLDPTTIIDTIAFSGTLAQTLPGGTYGTVQILGRPTVDGNFETTGNLIIANGAASTARFEPNGHRVDVGGDLIVTNGALIDLLQLGDSLIVAGNATFSGAPNSGFNTGGVLAIGGNFTQTGGATFAPSGTHKTVLNGTGLQTVSFANFPVSFFRSLFVEKASGSVNFATNAQVNGVLRASTSLTGASPVRIIADTLWGAVGSSVTPFVFELRRTMADSGTFSPDTVVFSGSVNTAINNTGPAGFGSYIYKSIRVDKLTASSSFGPGPFTVQNDLVVSRGTLVMSGEKVSVLGNFRTESTGNLQLTNLADSLGVAGNVAFMGGTSSLSSGVLTIGGNFQQGGLPSSFAPTLTQRTKFIGSAPGVHTISFADFNNSFFRDLILDKPAGSGQEIRLISPVRVLDSMVVQGGTDLTSLGTERLIVLGHFVYVGAQQPTVRPFVLELQAFSPSLDSTFINLPKFRPDTLVFSGSSNYFVPFSNYTALRHIRTSTTGIVDLFLSGANDTLAGDLHISQGRVRMQSGSTIMKKLRTTDAGSLEMSIANPTILVRDSAIFAGWSVNPFLTSGTLRLLGHFVQNGNNNPASFNADPPHTVEFAGTSLQNITLGTPGLTFALSHFGNLRITNPVGVNFTTDVMTHVFQDINPGTQEKVFGNGFKLTAEGANIRNTLFDNTLVSIIDGQTIVAVDTVTFQNYATGVDILTVARSAPIATQFNGLTFPVPFNPGRYIVVNDPNGPTTGGQFSLVISQATPLTLPLAQCLRSNSALLTWNGQSIVGC